MPDPLERFFPNLSHRQRVVLDWVFTLVAAVAVVLALKAWVVNPYRIPSPSMVPTLLEKDRVLANRFIYHFRDPKRAEIVVFNAPDAAREQCGEGGVFVKRIIGLPGETWEERDGYTYINGRRLSEPYIQPNRRDRETEPPRRIPDGMYFMEGDNRDHSCDSRVWGVIPRSAIIGEVFLTYWPLGRIGTH